ncbi:HNH endonuclease family protein [Colwellia sp. Bg11-28]|uniref:HNH endonuclease family protein n=1 Tax=Colwellia sp. Bg11-28 TaxID=2058305 RepID=UPI000C32BF72|nr:HNH endonuclease family protein [Colwellia sp. Bg11-28]PKH86909.1 HNH endonuclease [Colwellia sp. Bg11-28]
MTFKSLLFPSVLLNLILLTPLANAETIKKSKSDICHDLKSPSYKRTKNFTSFNSLASCIESGGRLAKNSSSTPVHTQKKSTISSNYSRKMFGHGWADSNKDCQNSRMETLITYSLSPVLFKTEKECEVASGKWISPFSGKTLYVASEIDIDHVVSLEWAWLHGANHWTKAKRVKFANDPANLLSVEARLNKQKGAKGLNAWLPPANQCQYISRFLRVYKTYNLTLSDKEKGSYGQIKKQYCN